MSSKQLNKRTSRTAAIQAMYQKNLTSQTNDSIIQYFTDHQINSEDGDYKDINIGFFRRLVSAFDQEIDYEKLVSINLTKNKSFQDVSLVTQCIIKVAIIERIIEKTDIPVIINEYVEISKSFVEKSEIRFINAILDKVLKSYDQ